jgi:hypothetical protein
MPARSIFLKFPENESFEISSENLQSSASLLMPRILMLSACQQAGRRLYIPDSSVNTAQHIERSLKFHEVLFF